VHLPPFVEVGRLAASCLTRRGATALAAAFASAACAPDDTPFPSAVPGPPESRRIHTTQLHPPPTAGFTDWEPPVNLGPVVNSTFGELGPAISPDGLALYFYSNRPGGSGGNDIWVTRRASRDAPWGVPSNLGPVINSSAADFVPSLSPDGTQLFFTSARPGGVGDNDLWVSRRDDTSDDFSWQPPVNLGAQINTPQVDAAAYVLTLRGKATMFFSRGPVLTNLDLFVTTETDEGFETPVAVAELNTQTATEAHASVRRDGREISFYSNRAGGLGMNDIWTSTRLSTNHPWAAPTNVSILNTASGDCIRRWTLTGKRCFSCPIDRAASEPTTCT